MNLFTALSASSTEFLCPYCKLEAQEAEIQSLKSTISALSSTLAEVQAKLNLNTEPSATNKSASSGSGPNVVSLHDGRQVHISTG